MVGACWVVFTPLDRFFCSQLRESPYWGTRPEDWACNRHGCHFWGEMCMRLLLVVGLLVACPRLYAQQQQSTTTNTPTTNPALTPTQIPPGSDPAPPWLAWRTFHNSLVFYNQKSPDALTRMLSTKFGLSTDQATALMTAGQKYLSDTQQIELQTRDEIRRRYIPKFSGKRLVKPTGPAQTTRQRAITDGLYDQMEKLHQNAVDSHLNSLKGKLTDAQISQIRTYVETTVVSSIKPVPVGQTPPTRGSGPHPGPQGSNPNPTLR